MRILLLHQYFHEKEVIGGSRFNEMTAEWAEQGHTITVLAGMIHYGISSTKPEKYKGKLLVKEQYSDKIEVIRCHVPESYNNSFVGRLWAYLAFAFFSILGGAFKARGRFDLILVTSPPLFVGLSGYLLSRLKRIPLVFEIRDLWPESAIDTGVLTNKWIIKFAFWFEDFVYRKSAAINVLTPAFHETLVEKKGVPTEKIFFIPNAADFRISEPLLNSFDPSQLKDELQLSDRLSIIYVGAHGVANHLVQVLETAKLLRDYPVVFLLVGDGMQKKSLVETKEQWHLENVIFVDPVPKRKVIEYILAADIGASVLKKTDAFKTVYSNKTFDYMSCKKPILMAIDGVSRQLVEEAGCGFYVEPENSEDFAAKIHKYLQEPSLVDEHGQNGYIFAKKHFDRTVLAKEYLKELERVLH